MPKYLDIDGLRTLWAQITNKISHESNATAEALEGKADLIEGKIPASQLPSYVDDVLEYANKASFPATGESGKIYLDLATNLAYRWGGTAYTEISPSLALGTTSSTAYRGDYGAAAYTHAVTNKGIAKSSGLYKITTNAEGHVTAATAVVKADITGLGIPAQDTTYENATTTTNGLMSSSDKTKLNSINLSALVKSVNGITPDSNGNVAIEVGGGTVSGDYLPLTGGTLSGNLTISNSNNYSYLYLANQNGENIGGLYASDGENRLYLINYAPNSTTGKYEGYGLPPVTTDNLTEHKWYKILTSKETVTIPQGGTGATTAADARTALGITPANIGALPLSGGTLTGNLILNKNLELKNGADDALIYFTPTNSNAAGGILLYNKPTSGNTDNSRIFFRQYSYSSSDLNTRTNYYENYYLPKTIRGLTANGSYEIITSKGGTITGTLTINNSNSTGGFVALMEDSEGGTIQIGSKTGAYTYEIDAYNDEILRVHTAVKNPNGGMKTLTWNGKSGNLTADGFTGSWLGNTIEINRGGTGATTPDTALANLGGRRVYTSVEALGLTAPATLADVYKAMPSHSSIVVQSAAPHAQIAEVDSPTQWGTLTLDKAYTYGHATWVTATSTHVVYDAYLYQSSTTATPTFSGWKKVITEIDFTDNKVAQTSTNPTTSTKYYPLAGSSSSTTTAGAVFNSAFNVNFKNGTASAEGDIELVLGNSTATGTAGNKTGWLCLYSPGTSYHMIKPASTNSALTHTLPAVSGTILNSGNYQNYAKLSNLGDVVVTTSTPSSVTNGKWYLVKQG